MKTVDQLKPNLAPVYAAAMYPGLAVIFQKHGYALAVHGSLARDLDLIAVPWTEEAADPEVVVAEILTAFAVTRIQDSSEGKLRPHGRKVFMFSCGFGHCSIDLGFVPRLDAEYRAIDLQQPAWRKTAENVDFARAFEAINKGKRVARACWTAGVYAAVGVQPPPFSNAVCIGGPWQGSASDPLLADDGTNRYTASTADQLATDWDIYTKVAPETLPLKVEQPATAKPNPPKQVHSTFDFNRAYDLIQRGQCVARVGWHPGTFVVMQLAGEDRSAREIVITVPRLPGGSSKLTLPYTASNEDRAANDWRIHQETAPK